MNTQERMDLLAELAETAHGTIRGGWMDRIIVEKEGSPLEGVELRLHWWDDGTVHVDHDGETILVARIEITASWVSMVNEPIGGEIQSQWSKVPAGWFVKTPKGDWLEVTDTALIGSSQFVGLRINGEVSHWNRDPKGEVWARRGSQAPRDRDDAMAALEEAFTTALLRDEPPGQS